MATFFSQIQHTYASETEDSNKDVNGATFLAATRESLALLGNLNKLEPVEVLIFWRVGFIWH